MGAPIFVLDECNVSPLTLGLSKGMSGERLGRGGGGCLVFGVGSGG